MAGERLEQLDLFGMDGVALSTAVGDAPSLATVARSVPIAAAIPVAVPVVAPVATPAVAIEDAGAELLANRRNRIRRAQSWADLAPLNDALRVKTAVKANIWPKPDYAQLIADGMKPLVAHIVKQVYDGVASKPVPGAGGLLDDARLQNYVLALNAVERGVMDWTTDPNAVAQWVKANIRTTGAMLGKFAIDLSELVGERETLLDKVFPDGWKAMKTEVMAAGGNKLLGALQPGYAEIRRAMKALDVGWPEKREAWEVQGYRVVENAEIEINESKFNRDAGRGAKFYVSLDGYQWPLKSFGTLEEAEAAKAAIGPVVLFGKRGVVDSFASRDEAVAMVKNLTTRDRGTVVGELGVKVEGIERVGVARRLEGEDISSERLMTEFGFKGVNFGNWMKTPSARAEAQLHLNHAFDSLHDLADLLSLPPKAMSLNGMIGLAIGAQGSGGTNAAHFVAGVNEINLTREKGAGSLTHEWGHALDHYFATYASLATSTEPFLTEHAGLNPVRQDRALIDGKWVVREVPRFGEIRPEILNSFKAIVQAMDTREQSAEEAKAAIEERLAKSRKSMESWLKSVRRDFVGIETEFDVLAERVRQGDLGDGHVAVSSSVYLSPVIVEMRALYKQKHGRVYSLDSSKAVQYWANAIEHQVGRVAAEADHVSAKVATDFATNAFKLDEDKGGKKYWSTKLEKFARAFDAFVSDELDARGIKNGYLAHQGREDVTVPMGAEREAVKASFRGLVSEIKTRETERGVALFSLGGTVEAEPEFKPVDTKSAEFKRWFGDSKVVGDDGTPLRVFHGTANDFTTFDGGRGGFYFTNDKKAAGEYANHADSDGGPRVIPAFLNVKNPMVLDRAWYDENVIFNGEPDWEIVDNAIYEAEEHGHDGLILRGFTDFDGMENGNRVERTYDQYVAFRPEQIKSAIGNTGQFNLLDGNILYSAREQAAAGRGLRAEMDAELVRMWEQWPSMPKVTVVNTVAGLPFSAPAHCDGAYYRGEVFVVAGNVESLRQFHKVMAHECILHHSLEDMLGSYGFSKLHCGIQALKASGDTVVCRLVSEIGERYGDLSPEDETREIVARAGERCLDDKGNLKIEYGFMKSVFAGMANWLRDHGIPVRCSNTELQGLMHDAGQWVRTERGVEVERSSGALATGEALHSFAGVRAENAPLEKLRVAREMQLAGVGDREIWTSTGWMFGFADGKPRFELADDGVVVEPRDQEPGLNALDDVALHLYGVAYGRLPFGEGGLLGEKRETVVAQARDALGEDAGIVAGNVRNSLLVDGYPEIGGLNAYIRVNDEGIVRGSFSENGIHADATRWEVTGVVVHELQHAVQMVEGFARGGSPSAFKDKDITDLVLARIDDGVQALYSANDAFYRDSVKTTQLMNAVQDKYGSLAEYDVTDSLVQDWWSAIDMRDAHPEADAWVSLKAEESQVRRDRVTISANEQYHRLAGEVEARLSGRRVGLSAEKRAERYPVDEMDVAVSEQAVEFRDEVRQQRAVSEGRYSGKILDIADGLATQKVGRGAEVVLHSLSRLSGPVAIGSVVDVVYAGGKGVVGGLGKGLEVGER